MAKYGRMYNQVVDALSVAAVCEIMFFKVPTTMVGVIHEIKVTQDTLETSEQQPLNIFQTATDQSAKGAAGTISKIQDGDAAHGGTARQNILTGETFATETKMIWRESQNQLNGWSYVPVESARPILPPGGMIVVKIDVAPGATTFYSAVMTFELIG